MPKSDRTRVDYTPSLGALEALKAAQALYPDDSTQALIDRLVITGLCALVHRPWSPPRLYGRREGWRLPPDVAYPENVD